MLRKLRLRQENGFLIKRRVPLSLSLWLLRSCHGKKSPIQLAVNDKSLGFLIFWYCLDRDISNFIVSVWCHLPQDYVLKLTCFPQINNHLSDMSLHITICEYKYIY